MRFPYAGDGGAGANAGEPVCDFVPGVYNTGTSVATTVEVTSDLESSRRNVQVAATAFVVLFCVVGLTVWGLPFYYDFMVQQFGWSRAQVTSGNALSKLVIGPAFGFVAGWLIDRFSPRRPSTQFRPADLARDHKADGGEGPHDGLRHPASRPARILSSEQSRRI